MPMMIPIAAANRQIQSAVRTISFSLYFSSINSVADRNVQPHINIANAGYTLSTQKVISPKNKVLAMAESRKYSYLSFAKAKPATK